MELEWDPEKARRNVVQHGVAFDELTVEFWLSSVTIVDDRIDYGETRLIAVGKIKDRVHVAVYTIRGHKRRIISLRRANKREQRKYERARV